MFRLLGLLGTFVSGLAAATGRSRTGVAITVLRHGRRMDALGLPEHHRGMPSHDAALLATEHGLLGKSGQVCR